MGGAGVPFRGRGAGVDPANRFEGISLEVLPERLEELAVESAENGGRGVRVATRVFVDRARTIINKVESEDLSFSWTINPYRGCEHGCSYCYARPTHEHFGLSCGLDFETKLFAKVDGARLLRRELSAPGWRGETIVMSGVTDPYQPVERSLGITRGLLEVMAECRQAVGIVTKNRMVTRDVDLLGELASHGATHVALSVTTLDAGLSSRMEPRASSPRDRLRAIEELSAAGIPVAVMVAPVIPGLNDHEIPGILEAVRDAGATSASWVMLRLPWGLKDVFGEWLARECPDRAGKVESLIRQMRGGELYDSRMGVRQRGSGAHAAQIKSMFEVHARRLGLGRRVGGGLRTDGFRRPREDDRGQMGLF